MKFKKNKEHATPRSYFASRILLLSSWSWKLQKLEGSSSQVERLGHEVPKYATQSSRKGIQPDLPSKYQEEIGGREKNWGSSAVAFFLTSEAWFLFRNKTIKQHFPDILAWRCNHVTVSGPMTCKNKCYAGFQKALAKVQLNEMKMSD